MDNIAVLARAFAGAVKADHTVEFDLADGSQLKGTLHRSLSAEAATTLMGRTLDLDAAYKQMLVKVSSLWASVLRVHDPAGEPHFFVCRKFCPSARLPRYSALTGCQRQYNLWAPDCSDWCGAHTLTTTLSSTSRPPVTVLSVLRKVSWT